MHERPQRIGRHKLCRDVHRGEYRRIFHGFGDQGCGGRKGGQPIGGAGISNRANFVPKPFQIINRALPPARDHPGLEGGCIQRARRGAGNRRNFNGGIGQQGFQHAPGERAMRAATLQGQIDAFDGLGHHIAVQPPSTLIVVPVI